MLRHLKRLLRRKPRVVHLRHFDCRQAGHAAPPAPLKPNGKSAPEPTVQNVNVCVNGKLVKLPVLKLPKPRCLWWSDGHAKHCLN